MPLVVTPDEPAALGADGILVPCVLADAWDDIAMLEVDAELLATGTPDG